jgi:hypothetical protein
LTDDVRILVALRKRHVARIHYRRALAARDQIRRLPRPAPHRGNFLLFSKKNKQT